MQEEKPFLHIIAGPTASGKTALAIQWAKRLNAEIVSADSQQVYRFFDIGTAKPSVEELAQVPHHLISVVDPSDAFNAMKYQSLADAAIMDIHRRGRQIIVVGGTGLYIRILLHGAGEAPGANLELRKAWEKFAREHGASALHSKLMAVDPVSAQRIAVKDEIRIIRALEIFESTGSPPSVFWKKHEFQEDRYSHRFLVLNPPREKLYESINSRAKAMFQAGLVEEVESLVGRGFKDAAPMRAVGYVQALDVLEGRLSLEKAIEDTARKTRNYAKRQWTWFRKERGAEFVAPPYPME